MAKSKVEYWLTDEGLTLLKGWAKDGLTDEQIANNMNISCSTFYKYKDKYVEISEALKKNKEVADYEVENSLFKRALGYDTPVLKHMKVKHVEYNDEGYKSCEYEEIVEIHDIIHVPADITAQIFWLKNRQPGKWREKQKELNDMSEDDKVLLVDDLKDYESNKNK